MSFDRNRLTTAYRGPCTSADGNVFRNTGDLARPLTAQRHPARLASLCQPAAAVTRSPPTASQSAPTRPTGSRRSKIV